jgi:GNAT superfamily N-acetyltransferase
VEDFLAVHSAANGADWCRCVAWWTPSWEGWGERSAGENAAFRAALFARGEFDGYLLYEGNRPVGWSQVGAAERLPKLCRSYGFTPEPGVQAISCFFVAPSVRGRGLAHVLLEGVLADLRPRCERVLAFPRRGEGLPAEDVWTGPESVFRRAGFREWRLDPARPILLWTREA